MSRSGYVDDYDGCDNNAYLLWPSIVKRAIQGKRGQAFLQEMATAMDAMPEKRLIADALRDEDGEVCAIGTVGACRGLDMSKLDPEDADGIAKAFKISATLVREIEFANDDDFCQHGNIGGMESEEDRWKRVRKWVAQQLTAGEGVNHGT